MRISLNVKTDKKRSAQLERTESSDQSAVRFMLPPSCLRERNCRRGKIVPFLFFVLSYLLFLRGHFFHYDQFSCHFCGAKYHVWSEVCHKCFARENLNFSSRFFDVRLFFNMSILLGKESILD